MEGKQHSVYVLGTIHGNMLDQPKNSLRDFVSALYLYRPDLILSEVRPDHPGGVEGAIDGGAEQALVHSFAKQISAAVVPVDWFDDEFNRQSESEDSDVSPALNAEVQPLFEKFRNVVQSGTFEESQSSETQALIRARYERLAKAGFKSTEIRNTAICENIQKHAPRFAEKRVLVVFGLAHKYALEDCLRRMGLKPLALEEWYDPIAARKLEFPDGLKTEAVQTLRSAKRLLSERLKQGYYRTDLENLSDKLAEFDQWIEHTNALSAD
jgi:hypothetical protein